jgi:hypothetical protein
VPIEGFRDADRFEAELVARTLEGSGEPVLLQCAAGGDPIEFLPGEIVRVIRIEMRG